MNVKDFFPQQKFTFYFRFFGSMGIFHLKLVTIKENKENYLPLVVLTESRFFRKNNIYLSLALLVFVHFLYS